ncbi:MULTISPECIES: DUF4256 domain-containing protein [Acinetobacter calcoaceticus/baumannii complex]|uniref:DUF4256 domain-containing protein n=1 Tax=Acinetobacter calcoaceticus/baumannii complex TaxID=909768 RepID=UPI0004539F03|nr:MULTISPECIES: DUF4256 domain-containing protein [Acinetobacter calcoaceticus/baumannii complex]AQV14311.1 hypothetical protein BMU11_01535 [Acinetobacter pittii]EXS23978.1 hypothetical protein J690_3790 [Acinetobacter sp. 742879]MBN6526286.1 DUF4256 domain-containing protein [Acinetobacter pittii]MCK0911909.1 DUF4256 domain-containing protein [Acinetobacter pittii]OON25802.1 hypothetical protein BI372_05775 [Acinetobacter pittii]
MVDKKQLTQKQIELLLELLKNRFEKNTHRHTEIKWSDVQNKLIKVPDKLWSLQEMENTGGEPDVIVFDQQKDQYLFVDCSSETPKGRRSLCYDREALESRKDHPPKSSAIDLANEMGVELLTEEQYYQLQEIEEFDLKTSSWLKTPNEIRKLDGALFADRRYGRVFIYHNGVQSYYAARGFRCCLRV